MDQETCSEGTCVCGAAGTCAGNTAADGCDAENDQCQCGEGPVCTLAEETCDGGVCKCGTAATCVGNAAADGCDAMNDQCTCGGIAECAGGMMCTEGACV